MKSDQYPRLNTMFNFLLKKREIGDRSIIFFRNLILHVSVSVVVELRTLYQVV